MNSYNAHVVLPLKFGHMQRNNTQKNKRSKRLRTGGKNSQEFLQLTMRKPGTPTSLAPSSVTAFLQKLHLLKLNLIYTVI